MEDFIKVLVYIHAFFGGIGLLAGIGSVAVKKGSAIHKKAGKVFSYSMILSSLISLFVAKMPNHENPFLFLIGIFTIYMVLSGNRALTLKSKLKVKADVLDYMVSGGMVLTSLVMIISGILALIQNNNGGVLYVFFGAFGLSLSLKDFQIFRIFTTQKSVRLQSHVARMVGALIASITAFLVAGLNIGTTLVWITPTIMGTGYIVFWSRKLRGKTVLRSA